MMNDVLSLLLDGSLPRAVIAYLLTSIFEKFSVGAHKCAL